MENETNNTAAIKAMLLDITHAVTAIDARVKQQAAAIQVLRVGIAAALQECGWREPLPLLEKIESEHTQTEPQFQQARVALEKILRMKERA